MDDLKRAKIKRRAQRTQASKIWSKAQTLMDGEMDGAKCKRLQVILETYNAKIELLRKLDEAVSSKIDDEKDLEAEIAEADDYLIELTEKRYQLQFLIESNQNAIHDNASPSSNNGHDSPTQSTSSQVNSSSHRLPKLILPIFSGNPLKWQTFWDTYKTAIHNNASLSDVQKFTYLKAQLSGEAANSIEGLPLSESNYAQSIELLEERFGQPHKIINAHMQALLDLPNPSDSVVHLRRFYDNMENHIRGLEALGKKQDTYGDLLIPIILAKLPTAIKHNLIRENGTTKWVVEHLRKAILKEIQILEAGEETEVLDRMNKPVITPPSTSSLLTNASQSKKRDFHSRNANDNTRPRSCVFCSGNHRPHECTVIRDPEIRKKIVFQSNLCFNCLNNHRVSKCNSKNRCRGCNQKHHTSLCQEIDNKQSKCRELNKTTTPHNLQQQITQNHDPSKIPNSLTQVQSTNTTLVNTTTPDQTKSVSSLHSGSSENSHPGKQTLLKTAINLVDSRTNSATAHILFDEGAQRSFITKELADKLDLVPENSETLNLSVFGGSATSVKRVDITTVYLRADNGEKIPIQVIIIPTIAAPQKSFLSANIRNLPHLSGLKLAHHITSEEQFQISLLIGADYYWDIVEDEIIRGPGPTAAKSKIGYLLSGPIKNTATTSSTLNANILKVVVSNEPENKTLEKFWNLESIGILPDEISTDESKFVTEYQYSSIKLQNGQYCAKLPWKDNHAPLPTNEAISRGRTRSTVRRLSKNPCMLAAYNDIINEQLKRDFIEKVNDPQTTNYPCHYIPHHPVFKDSSTTPLRIVYDCSCTPNTDQPSLNSCLSTGPDILNDMTAILVRFRCYRYGVTADIEKAFLNISLDQKDRDATRFFWLSDPTNPESEFDVYRFKSVLFGAACSPFILNATIKKHLDNFEDPVAQRMKSDIYVDNLASGTDNEDEALHYVKQARSIMSPVKFNLRSWNSNSSKLTKLTTDKNIQDKDPETKVLGLRWNAKDDVLKLQEKQTHSTVRTITKREVLRESSKIYDPLGLLTPVTIRAKIFIQELWEQGCAWDESLPEDAQKKWIEISRDLEKATHIQIQRRYFPLLRTWPANVTLHVFVDASIKAYGTVAYVTSGSHCSMVMSKSRVAPIKKLTLPQLELMAAVIGARIASYLRSHLRVKQIICWSDSQIVLCWLSSEKELKRFVQNRVNEIHHTLENVTWNYCPTSDNPADLLTRGIQSDALFTSHLWNHGPSWLTKEEAWPKWDSNAVLLQSSTHNDVETDHITSSHNTKSRLTHQTSNGSISQIINHTHFSDLQRLLRTTAWVIRFINALRKHQMQKGQTLSTKELDHAKNVWIRAIQSNVYNNEIANLRQKNPPRLQLVRQLRLFIPDDGIIRCGGRIHNAPIEYSTKFPILLPPNDHFTTLVVDHVHKKTLHSGLNYTLTHVRQQYWIPSARQVIKKLLRRCVTCRKVNGKPYNAPDPPPLPAVRLADSHPFTVTGVDFSGAIFVKTPRGQEKVYICLFTCANTRAVHLEVVSSLTVPSFIAALRRFASRKSLPQVIISDNASTYQSAAEELTRLFRSAELTTSLGKRGIEWKFIPKRAPWYGGFWERLIGLTKLSLKKVLGKANISLEELQTILTEIEAVLNDRPLTYPSSELDDEGPLTPSHLLYGRKITTLPYYTYDENVVTDPTYQPEPCDIEYQATRKSELFLHFWKRWRQEYLTSLREFHKASGINQININIGDVVQVHDDTKRVNWRLAVVESLIYGNDGMVRAANIKTTTGYTNRPITKLYPLEVTSATTKLTKPKTHSHDSQNEEQSSTPPITHQTEERPVRAKAQLARKKIKQWASALSCPPEDVEN